tara:strand:+ start:899 stop:1084 length:186 start_codon:yes stop_codon:yes gene_type:complete
MLGKRAREKREEIIAKREEAEKSELEKRQADVKDFSKRVYIIVGVVGVLGAIGIYFLTKKK